jgi:transcriptional regulator with XRE-family HTH domain
MVAEREFLRTDRRTRTGRAAFELRVRIGAELRRARVDAGLSIRAVAHAAKIDPSHLALIERGEREASLAVLIAIGRVLGLDLSVRLFPTTGPRIHDRIQAAIVEALLREAHAAWRRLVEVPVWRPARGVIDAVFARPGSVIVATEVHSELRRLEELLRWGEQKAESLPSAEAWTMLAGGRASVSVSRLLVLRSTRANREAARAYETTLRAAFPALMADAVQSLRDPSSPWPGSTLLWARLEGGAAQILERPPRGVALGR